jgi:hypothetical protein
LAGGEGFSWAVVAEEDLDSDIWRRNNQFWSICGDAVGEIWAMLFCGLVKVAERAEMSSGTNVGEGSSFSGSIEQPHRRTDQTIDFHSKVEIVSNRRPIRMFHVSGDR